MLPGPVGPVELLGSPRGLGGGRCCFSEGDAADTRMKAAAGKRGGLVSPPRSGLKGAGARSDFFLASMQRLFRQWPAWPLHKNITQRSHCFLVRVPQQTLLGL